MLIKLRGTILNQSSWILYKLMKILLVIVNVAQGSRLGAWLRACIDILLGLKVILILLELLKLILMLILLDEVSAAGKVKTAQRNTLEKVRGESKKNFMMGIPNEHQLKFNSIKDAKQLLEAIDKSFDMDAMSMDDLSNNFKVYEPEVKGMSSSNSNTQNMAFLSSTNNSTNTAVNTAQAVNTANRVSTTSTQVNTLNNLSDGVICAFLASQPNSPQLAHEDLEQIYPDDIEEMDLRCCHKRGHFSRECRAPISQDTKHKESTRRSVPVETPASIALVSCDGLGRYGWSDQAEEGPNYALMAYTSLSSDSKNEQLLKDLKKSKLMVLGYKIGLQSVEERLEIFKKSKFIYLEDIKVIKVQIQMKDIAIKELKRKLELDNYKKGLGYESYNVVIPLYTGNFMPLKPDLSYIRVYEFAVKHVVKNKSSEEETKAVRKNPNAPIVEEWVSDDKEENGNPQIDLQDKRVIDCGYSRHMTENMSYLTDYEEIDGEYGNFRGNPKGGKIAGKDDYSRFTLIFFLATKDETSGILNSFITRIENLVDHKSSRNSSTKWSSERRNMTLIEAARTMLANSKLPTTFWEEAVNTACYVQNRVLVVKPNNKTPYELFHGRTPTLSFMRPFRCLVTILNTKDHLGKFDGKADEGFFVGYSLNSKAFRVFNSRTKIVERTCILGTQSDDYAVIKACDNVDLKSSHNDGFKPLSDDGNKVDEDPSKGNECTDEEKEDNVNNTNNVNNVSLTINVAGTNNDNELPFDPNMPSLKDVGTFDFSNKDEDDCKIADMNNLDTSIQVSPTPRRAFTIQVTKSMNFSRFTKWKRAKGTKWVFRNKNDDRGIVTRNKARLVAQGHTQQERIDYDEVFSLVARIEAIRPFLAYASFKYFVVYQMDVKSDFLYGKIKEKVYVCQPPGFEDLDFPDRVYIVKKALYGLHQALRAWKELCNAFERLMHEKFQMISMGEHTFFLGLQVKQKNDGIFISQNKYVAKILKKFGFTEVKNASTPMETQKPLLKDKDDEEVDVHMYRYQVNPKVSHLHTVKRTFRVDPINSVNTELTRLGWLGFRSVAPSHNLDRLSDVNSRSVDSSSFRSVVTLSHLDRVLALEKIKTTQALEIISLKRRVKKFEKKQRSRNHKLKRLYKVGLTAMVDSYEDEPNLGEDASKQGRIKAIDTDEDITIVNDQDAKMFNVSNLQGEKVFIENELADKEVNDEVQKVVEEVAKDINTAKLIVNVAQVSAAGEINIASITTNLSVAATVTTNEITLAQALVEIKTLKPKAKGIVLQEPSESRTTTTKIISLKKSQDKDKAIMIEEPVKPKKKDQIRLDEEAALKLQAELQAEFEKEQRLARKSDKKEQEANFALIEEWDDIQAKINKMFDRAFKRVNTFVDFRTDLVEGSSKRVGEEIKQGSLKRQKVDDNKETTELKKLMKIITDEEKVAIDSILLVVKSPKIVDWKNHKEGKKSYYQIIRADGNFKIYMVFNRILKEFDKEELEDLYSLVKSKYGSTMPVEDLDLLLWGDLKTMFEPHVEDQV
nr:retrovirus-related Pol polyprotein from transposon TNT 1-94 [Tanacetum cinerariifolium]